MNVREMTVLLTKINARDKYPRWTTPEAVAFTATEWVDDLKDVPLVDALNAMREHYASSDERITIAIIRDAVPVHDSSWVGNVTEQRLRAVTS